MYADSYNVKFKMNEAFPVNTLYLMRGAIYAKNNGLLEKYNETMFNAMWVDNVNLNDPKNIITTLEENGSIDIVTPSGKIIAQDKKDIELPLPENGDYLMQVNPIRGNVSFEVTFKILSVPSN